MHVSCHILDRAYPLSTYDYQMKHEKLADLTLPNKAIVPTSTSYLLLDTIILPVTPVSLNPISRLHTVYRPEVQSILYKTGKRAPDLLELHCFLPVQALPFPACSSLLDGRALLYNASEPGGISLQKDRIPPIARDYKVLKNARRDGHQKTQLQERSNSCVELT